VLSRWSCILLTVQCSVSACRAVPAHQHQAPSSGYSLKILGGSEDRSNRFTIGLVESGSRTPFCGAAVIAPGVAVTAAHCVWDRKRPLWVALPSANGDLTRPAALERVTAIYVHPDYSRMTKQADLAVLKISGLALSSSGSGDSAPPSIIPIAMGSLPDNAETAIVSGWGEQASHGSKRSLQLQRVTLPINASSACRVLGGPYASLTDQQICAGSISLGGIDSCQGDSGGPMWYTDANAHSLLVGVVSWGVGCGQPGHPGVYARLAAYRAWIDQTINGDPTDTHSLPGSDVAPPAEGEVLAHCYDQLRTRTETESNGHRIAVIGHAHHLAYINTNQYRSPDDTATPMDGSLICRTNLPGRGAVEVYLSGMPSQTPDLAALAPSIPLRTKAIVIKVADTQALFAAELTSYQRMIVQCNATSANPDPVAVVEDAQSFVTWRGRSFTMTLDAPRASTPAASVTDTSTDSEPPPALAGCQIGAWQFTLQAAEQGAGAGGSDPAVASLRDLGTQDAGYFAFSGHLMPEP